MEPALSKFWREESRSCFSPIAWLPDFVSTKELYVLVSLSFFFPYIPSHFITIHGWDSLHSTTHVISWFIYYELARLVGDFDTFDWTFSSWLFEGCVWDQEKFKRGIYSDLGTSTCGLAVELVMRLFSEPLPLPWVAYSNDDIPWCSAKPSTRFTLPFFRNFQQTLHSLGFWLSLPWLLSLVPCLPTRLSYLALRRILSGRLFCWKWNHLFAIM